MSCRCDDTTVATEMGMILTTKRPCEHILATYDRGTTNKRQTPLWRGDPKEHHLDETLEGIEDDVGRTMSG